jgi:hypothetical protein
LGSDKSVTIYLFIVSNPSPHPEPQQWGREAEKILFLTGSKRKWSHMQTRAGRAWERFCKKDCALATLYFYHALARGHSLSPRKVTGAVRLELWRKDSWLRHIWFSQASKDTKCSRADYRNPLVADVFDEMKF